ncbi:hypothetical protein [Ectothiorhodospira shaposhnikovii]|uniref:hypothetical protein n=1 Tax=Ectothiorhodospira shaposhnikovii TaxID=1054 RepID=UPI001F5B66A1|nr:hypothetical protein [Ectothiorhodospira shaposhnikovii]
MPSGEPQVIQKKEQPSRGMDMNSVLNRHGEPEIRHSTVGDPPITRWDYDGFSVIFEGRFVIHTVVRSTQTSSTTVHP